MMTIATIAAIAISALLLVLLCAGDPKRRRSARLEAARPGPVPRRALVAASAVPGVALAFAGDTAATFVWLGGYAICGWFLAQGFARPHRAD